ncbi:hypothetical protein [Brevundimonas sp. TWP1-2-1b1]|uniref:hypothetical protein n=1 Tax=unclassified Brevundimonas TaxID=2622653 RepID=UPI003CE9C52A
MSLPAKSRVTVIDDDKLGLEALMDDLRDCDFEPMTVSGPFGTEVDRMVSEIQTQDPAFVICDHKLQPLGLAAFYGLEVVRRLVEDSRPAMLLTMYQQTSRMRMDLRASRHLIPVIMGRGDFEAEAVAKYAEVCLREIRNDPVDERRSHRSLIRVDWAEPSSETIDAVIGAWSPDHAITIPSSCIDPLIRPRITVGTYLMGDINVGADGEDDLYFTNVNEIVEVQDIEGLSWPA